MTHGRSPMRNTLATSSISTRTFLKLPKHFANRTRCGGSGPLPQFSSNGDLFRMRLFRIKSQKIGCACIPVPFVSACCELAMPGESNQCFRRPPISIQISREPSLIVTSTVLSGASRFMVLESAGDAAADGTATALTPTEPPRRRSGRHRMAVPPGEPPGPGRPEPPEPTRRCPRLSPDDTEAEGTAAALPPTA